MNESRESSRAPGQYTDPLMQRHSNQLRLPKNHRIQPTVIFCIRMRKIIKINANILKPHYRNIFQKFRSPIIEKFHRFWSLGVRLRPLALILHIPVPGSTLNEQQVATPPLIVCHCPRFIPGERDGRPAQRGIRHEISSTVTLQRLGCMQCIQNLNGGIFEFPPFVRRWLESLPGWRGGWAVISPAYPSLFVCIFLCFTS